MNITYINMDDKRDPDFKWYLDEQRSYYLFVLFKSPVTVRIDGSYVDADSGMCVIYDKNMVQEYFPQKNKQFIHDYIQFKLDENEEQLYFPEIPLNQLLKIYVLEEFVDFLRVLCREFRTNTMHKDAILSGLETAFLYKLKKELQYNHIPYEKSVHFEQLYMLKKAIYDHPEKTWTIEKMSQSVNMSCSHLQTLYKSFFEESCMNDVIRARIKKAKELLQYTNMKVQDVSERCGYKNIEHFNRQFKKIEGLTPIHYRLTTKM